MTYRLDDLNRKSDTELDAIADELALMYNSESTSKAEKIAVILAAQDAPSAPVTLDVTPAPKKRTPAKKTEKVEPAVAAAPKERRFKILIHNQEGVDASPFVKVHANGTMFAIPRETEVEVPEIVMNILRDAVVDRLVYENGKPVTKSGRRFPYTVLGEMK